MNEEIAKEKEPIEIERTKFIRKDILISFFLGLLAGLLGAIAQAYVVPHIIKPDIKIFFEWEKPYIINYGLSGKYNFYHFRIRILNDSIFAANNCKLMLTELSSYDKNKKDFVSKDNFEPVLLEKYNYMPSNISPGMSVFAKFAQIANTQYQTDYEKNRSGGEKEPQFRFSLIRFIPWLHSHAIKGKHKFKIAIYFDNRDPVVKEFELVWNGLAEKQWPVNQEELDKFVTIKMLN